MEQREVRGRYRRYQANDVLTLGTLLAWAMAVWMLRADGVMLAACWLLIGAIWCSPMLRDKGRAASTEPVEDANYPFGTDAQWQSAKHHLEMFRLPAYTAPDKSRPLRSPLVERIMSIPGYVMMAALAPLWMLLSLRPRRRKQRVVP